MLSSFRRHVKVEGRGSRVEGRGSRVEVDAEVEEGRAGLVSVEGCVCVCCGYGVVLWCLRVYEWCWLCVCVSVSSSG